MAANSAIEWTDTTWNPVTGCTKISSGCANCYAERLTHRLKAMGLSKYRHGFAVAFHPALLDEPLHWRSPRRVFVNSMGDLFHPGVPLPFIQKVFETMNRCPHHQFQVLTKRSSRLAEVSLQLDWTPNIWTGVTVENKEAIGRVNQLTCIPAAVRFLSCEPLLGPLEGLPLDGISWVIVGGESGPGARPMREEWVVSIYDQCRSRGVPFFFKQWGGTRKKAAGRILLGQYFNEMPVLHNFLPV